MTRIRDWREYLDEDRPPTAKERWEEREFSFSRAQQEDRVRPDRLLADELDI